MTVLIVPDRRSGILPVMKPLPRSMRHIYKGYKADLVDLDDEDQHYMILRMFLQNGLDRELEWLIDDFSEEKIVSMLREHHGDLLPEEARERARKRFDLDHTVLPPRFHFEWRGAMQKPGR